MSIEEAKAKKLEAEIKITKILLDVEEDTGLFIEEIFVERSDSGDFAVQLLAIIQ
jgi:hypothetical protein